MYEYSWYSASRVYHSEPSIFSLDELREYLLDKAFVFSDTSTENYLVVLIHNPHSQLSFARVGDDKWTWLPPHTHYADCIYKDGILYAVNKVGEIHAFDLSGPVVTMKTIIEMVPGYACDKMYIVQAPWGDLLQVWRSYEYIEGDYEADLHDADPAISVENTAEIKIFVVDTVEKKRVEIENLDGHVLFLGHNQSLCLSTEQYPHLKENYTYFTDDNDLSLFGHKNNRRDIGLFDLKHNSREELVSPQLWSNFPAPVLCGSHLRGISEIYKANVTNVILENGKAHTCPAFKKMLEHLHHVVLNKFKSDLDQSLRSGGGFAASARYCAQSSMVKLNARSSQISKVWCSFDSFIDDECLNHSLVKHAVWDTTEVRGKLEHHIEAHATSVRDFPLLSRDKDSMPRTWKGNEDISAITREARLAAANRLDNKPDKIDRTLTTALLDGRPLSQKRSIEFASDPIVSSTWEEVLALRFRKL
ncbi:hypothetical protein OsJ_12379 [Oryza sativa Japonica Group]|uniref:Uncharacterized protein n=1 Tax=Oryza sativa subsp. japonica TaxID=39947 RepID=B9FB86_ORYSJ|nr:hypothetical protein OsJ_12379 [Oryza sativa Japonica Group]